MIGINVPPLRFPEFTEEWRKYYLKDLVNRVKNKNKHEQSKLTLTISAQYGLIDQESFFNKKIASADLSGYYLLKNGDFAYNKSYSSNYPWGAIKRLDLYEEGVISPLYICFRPLNQKLSNYLVHYFESNKWHKGIADIAVEGARNHGLLNVSVEDYFETEHFIPSDEREKQKIAEFLELISKRIAIQNKIIEDYIALMNSIMTHVFKSPNNKRWKEVKLGDICDRITRRNTNIESDLVLTIASQYGLVSQKEYFHKSVASADLSNYFLLEWGDFAYNKSYSGDYAWGAIKRLDLYPKGVLSPLYICFRPKNGVIDSDFLTFLFESKCWYKEVAEICVEGARNHGLLNVSIGDFFNMKLFIPSIDDQKRISEMLKTFKSKLVFSQKLLELYIQQKKYLLSQLFL